MNQKLNINSNIILLSISVAVITSLFSTNMITLLILIITLTLIYILKSNVVFGVIIAGYLVFTSEFFEEYRIFISAFSTILLLVLFFKEYGLKIKNYPKVPKEILLFIFLLLLILLQSTIFSLYPFTSLVVAFRLLIFFVITYLFYTLIQDENTIYVYIYSILSVLLFFGALIGLDLYNLGIENYFIRGLISERSDLYGSLGYTGSTIFFISISLLTGMFFIGRFNLIRRKILLSILFIFNIGILIFANSRGGIVAAIISVAFILFVLKTKILKSLIILIFITTILMFVNPSMFEIANNYLRWHTLSDREPYWQMGINIIQDYPFFGLGPGLFDKYFYSYASSDLINYFKNPLMQIGSSHPHNLFLYYTAENGIPGLLISIGFFVMFFYFAIKTMKITKSKNKDYFILSTTITGIGIALFFRSFIEVTGYLTYGYITTDLPFWLLFGVLIWIYKKVTLLQ